MSVPHRVLLIEDNDVDAALFTRCVEVMAEWSVERVTSLDQAEELVGVVGQRWFDLVAVDLTLPDAVDLEAIHFARRTLPQAAIVAVTARPPEEVDERALRAGAADLLVKGQMNARGVQRALTHAVERNRLVRRQLESERNLRSVLAAWSDGLFVVDAEGRILFRNDAAVAFADGLVEDREGPRLAIEITPGEVVRSEVARPAGDPVPVEVTAWSIQWADVPARVVVVRDRRGERAAEQARKFAEIGSGALKGVHDIGNRVAAMLSTLSEAEEAVSKGQVAGLHEALGRLRSSCEHIGSVVRASRADASTVRASRVPVDLGELARASCEALRNDLSACATLRLQVEPASVALADPVQLTRVLDNLLRNAIEAIGPGHPDRHQVRVTVRQDDARVVLEVADSGPGISAELQAHIFDQGVTTKAEGTGLGLASVRAILTDLGGTIEVESSPGHGACFRVVLPALHARSRSQRVLLLEDNPEVSRANERLLGQRYRIDHAGDGGEALERLGRDAAYDAILCDLDMPGMDGRAFYERLRSDRPELADRVIFCSGGAASAEMDAFLRAAARPMLPKPILLGEAIAAIELVAAR